MRFPEKQTETYWKFQGFEPTGAQKKVLEDIAADLRKKTAMSRLVQGDVGCGKTAVAFGAVSLAYAAGYQSTMMAPTEILAVQHYENAKKNTGACRNQMQTADWQYKGKRKKNDLTGTEELSV